MSGRCTPIQMIHMIHRGLNQPPEKVFFIIVWVYNRLIENQSCVILETFVTMPPHAPQEHVYNFKTLRVCAFLCMHSTARFGQMGWKEGFELPPLASPLTGHGPRSETTGHSGLKYGVGNLEINDIFNIAVFKRSTTPIMSPIGLPMIV